MSRRKEGVYVVANPSSMFSPPTHFWPTTGLPAIMEDEPYKVQKCWEIREVTNDGYTSRAWGFVVQGTYGKTIVQRDWQRPHMLLSERTLHVHDSKVVDYRKVPRYVTDDCWHIGISPGDLARNYVRRRKEKDAEAEAKEAEAAFRKETEHGKG